MTDKIDEPKPLSEEQRQECYKSQEILQAQELLADTFEPKRKFRWILEFNEIDSYLVQTAERPKYVDGKPTGVITVSLYDPVIPNGAWAVMKWIEKGLKETVEKDNLVIKLLDPVGVVIETWIYKNVKLHAVDFGNLDYSDSSPVVTTCKLKYEDVELVT